MFKWMFDDRLTPEQRVHGYVTRRGSCGVYREQNVYEPKHVLVITSLLPDFRLTGQTL